MEAMENLIQLSESMQQAASLLGDEDTEEPSRQTSTFLNVVALGNVLRQLFVSGALRHSLQDRLSKGASFNSTKNRVDEIFLKLRTSTAPPLKLIDLPGLDQRVADESTISDYAEHSDAVLLVVVPASQAPEISSSRALKLALEFDPEGTRTIGVISKIDQAASDQKSLAAVQALLLSQGPRITQDVSWVALIGQSVSIASAQSGSVGAESSLETAWRAESESLKSILTGAPQSKLGRVALVDTLARQIRKRMKLRLPSILSGLEGRSQIVEDELLRLGEQLVQTSEGTRAIALELCREFEDKFLQHIATGEGGGWKVVASFEGNFPNRIKQLPLDRHFDLNNVKKVFVLGNPFLVCFRDKEMLDRQRREEELKNRASKKGHDAEQALLNRATSPQTGGQQTGASLKSMKDKPNQTEKDNKEASVLQSAGPGGELTAGFLLKRSAKTNGWSRRWFVLNEKTGKLGYTKKPEERHFRGVITLEECIIEEVPDDSPTDPPAKSSSKANGPDSGKAAASLVFKISTKVPYKTVLKAHSTVLLKAENMADKVEWVSKIRNVIQPSKGASAKGVPSSESGATIRSSHSDGSLDTMVRRPADPEEELKMMSQEVRGYVEAVLNSLAANVPKAVVLCQVEKAKDEMLTQLYSSISAHNTAKIEELLQEDQNAKRKRERYKKQADLLSKLTRQLSVHDARASSDTWSANGGSGSVAGGAVSINEDWRVAFDSAANGPVDHSNSFADSPRINSSSMNGHSRRLSDPGQNGDANSSRRTPNRLPPPPPSLNKNYS